MRWGNALSHKLEVGERSSLASHYTLTTEYNWKRIFSSASGALTTRPYVWVNSLIFLHGFCLVAQMSMRTCITTFQYWASSDLLSYGLGSPYVLLVCTLTIYTWHCVHSRNVQTPCRKRVDHCSRCQCYTKVKVVQVEHSFSAVNLQIPHSSASPRDINAGIKRQDN